MRLDEAYANLNIVQDLIPPKNSNRPGTRLSSTSVTIHNADNSDAGANAAAHASMRKELMPGSGRFHGNVPAAYQWAAVLTAVLAFQHGLKDDDPAILLSLIDADGTFVKSLLYVAT
jgi:hypothetical protein